ncbi:MAG: DNA polymerase III subunit gamma/tau [Nevskiaceae bacterium]|nr:MAG: DNA polymerase III subunit gamma/tau [Nevskiaceae bacterium]TBR74014.1 MAG: DNA polymerase III subunit gamma/tau [Nevskiaceae bacterium]
MSYLTLARRYRPRRFEDVRGQEPVVQALSHALEGDKLHPALLLTGTRGVGKTTLGRIIAKCLNCEKGVSPHPCGECSACREVDEGRFIDLIEIDAASRTKVEDTRQLLDNVAYAPARGRYKVYLIDEVHMLSTSSFNALLKTLEEPPPHVKFILATTDPQKLPVTVLSRCLKFNLRRLPVTLIRDVLAEVAQREQVDADPTALAVLARAADGSMRDGLSLLDQAIAYGSGARLEREAMETMLGTTGRSGLLALLACADARDGKGLVAGLDELTAIAPDYAALLDMLAADLQRIAVLQVLPEAADDDDDPRLAELAVKIAPEDVQIDYEIAVHAARDLRWAPDPRIGFEMAVLRMYAFRPQPVGGGDGQRAPAAPVSASDSALAAPMKHAAPAQPAAPRMAGPQPPEQQPQPALPPVRGLSAANDQIADGHIAPEGAWPDDVEVLRLAGLARELARHCACTASDTSTVNLALEAECAHLLAESRRAEIEQALAAATGVVRRVTITTSAPGVALATAARMDVRDAQVRQQTAEAAIENSAAAQALKDIFGATLRAGSVRPVM